MKDFFTFVVKDVDSTNNHAERIIRYAVIMRKISFHTMSDHGSETMSILMSVFKTLELQNKNVFREALRMAQDCILNQKKTKKRLSSLKDYDCFIDDISSGLNGFFKGA